MQRFRIPNFSFSPVLALLPGLMLLGAFNVDGPISTFQLLVSALMILVGGVWAGLKSSRSLTQTTPHPQPKTQVDISLASAILDALPDPVLLLDKRRHVVASNRAANALLGEGVHGRDVCLTLRHPDAQNAVKTALDGKPSKDNIEIIFDSPVRRVYQLQVMNIPKEASNTVRAVVALHDLTTLKHVEDMRADFVANVSHELRSPLSSLTGFIETLQTTAKDDAKARERFLSVMDGETSRMARLIEDLLSLSRIEVKEHIRPTARVNLSDILATVAQSVELRAAQKGMSIDIHMDNDLPPISGDTDQLHQVLQNLIDNAVTYGAEKTTVNVSLKTLKVFAGTDTPGVKISVENFGEGISEEHLARLTERFYRVDKGRSRAMGGTGLGLAIVKHIVNRHRGHLLIDSELGKGSVFSVHLPAIS